jgi:hypothetical protein
MYLQSHTRVHVADRFLISEDYGDVKTLLTKNGIAR